MMVILFVCLQLVLTSVHLRKTHPSFPLKQFLNISHLFDENPNRNSSQTDQHNKLTVLFDEWKEKIMCGTDGFNLMKSCECSPKCMKYKTCCADAFWYDGNTTDIGNYTRAFLSKARQQKKYECREAFPFKRNDSYREKKQYYYMVSGCRDEYVGSFEEYLCRLEPETLSSSSIPVLSSDNHLYKNLHCAKCNGADEFQFVPIELNCKTNTSICYLRINLGKLNVTLCDKVCHYKGECKPDNKYFDRCYSHSSVYNGYDNIFCYQCVKGEVKKLTKSFLNTSVWDKLALKCMIGQNNVKPFPHSWYSLLKLSDGSRNKVKENGCPDDHIFTLLTSGCLKMSCPVGFQVVNSKCRKMTTDNLGVNIAELKTDTYNSAFRIDCIIKEESRFYVKGISDLRRFLKESFQGTLDKSTIVYRVQGNKETNGEQYESIVEMRNITTGLKKIILSDTGLVNSEFLIENSSILIGSQFAPFQYPQKLNFSNIFINDNICEKPLLLDNNNITFSNSCHASYRGETIENHNLSVWIDIRSGQLKTHIFTCESPYFLELCPLKLIKSNLTADNNTSLESGSIRMTDIKLEKNDLCQIVVKKTKLIWDTTIEKASGFTSLAGTLLSIISYICLFVTFGLLKGIRNHPGYCVLSMSINLFLADILYVLGIALAITGNSGSLNVCLPIGSLMHLFLLSGQFWSVVMAIDVSLNVFLTKLVFSTGTKKKFIMYCLITYSLAIAFAAVGVLCNRFNLLDAKYNENNVCALSGFYARMILYFIPLAISTVIGISVLCVSICIASKTNRENTKTLGDDARRKKINFINIALKLVIICGLSEAIGFIQIYKTDHLTNFEHTFNSVFGFLYSVMKGFRGFMLCIVFLYNERVKNFYRDLFNSHSKSVSRTETEMYRVSTNKKTISE